MSAFNGIVDSGGRYSVRVSYLNMVASIIRPIITEELWVAYPLTTPEKLKILNIEGIRFIEDGIRRSRNRRY